jgi:hypothetical protein
MAEFIAQKHVSNLPATLEANTVYFVKNGAGFDLYLTNSTGTIVAFGLNPAVETDPVFTTTPLGIVDDPNHGNKFLFAVDDADAPSTRFSWINHVYNASYGFQFGVDGGNGKFFGRRYNQATLQTEDFVQFYTDKHPQPYNGFWTNTDVASLGRLSRTSSFDTRSDIAISNSTGLKSVFGWNGSGTEIDAREGSLFFDMTGVTRMTLTQLGFLGLGTNAPTQKLDVVGNGVFSGTVDAYGAAGSYGMRISGPALVSRLQMGVYAALATLRGSGIPSVCYNCYPDPNVSGGYLFLSSVGVKPAVLETSGTQGLIYKVASNSPVSNTPVVFDTVFKITPAGQLLLTSLEGSDVKPVIASASGQLLRATEDYYSPSNPPPTSPTPWVLVSGVRVLSVNGKVEGKLDVVAPEFQTFGKSVEDGGVNRKIQDVWSGVVEDVTGNNQPHLRNYTATRIYAKSVIGSSVGVSQAGWRDVDINMHVGTSTPTQAHVAFQISSGGELSVEMIGLMKDTAGKAWPVKIYAAGVGGSIINSTVIVAAGTGVTAEWYLTSSSKMGIKVTTPAGSSWNQGHLVVQAAYGSSGMVLDHQIVFQSTNL